MDANQFVGANYLSSSIVKNSKLSNKNIMITKVRSEIFKEKSKLVLGFAETEYELPLNVTNTKILIEKFGSDTDKWQNKLIQLIVTKTNYQGSFVDSILINADVQQPS